MTHLVRDMTNGTETPTEAEDRQRMDSRLFELADACFEMFSLKELRHPKKILPELKAAFPDLTATQISQGISVALSWKRLLGMGGKTLH
jgi:hypothetical protein